MVAFPKLLSSVLALDGLIALAFGIASWLAPHATFGTVVQLGGVADGALLLAALASVSALYVLLGAVSCLAASLPTAHRRRCAMLLAIGHVGIGAKGWHELDAPWLIGNPWPDLFIHGGFAAAYFVLIAMTRPHRDSAA